MRENDIVYPVAVRLHLALECSLSKRPGVQAIGQGRGLLRIQVPGTKYAIATCGVSDDDRQL